MQDTNSIYGLLKESAEKYAGKTAVLLYICRKL